ncbi:MAG: DNA replication/repair protein RecF [Armatimonadota bacterium]
MYVSSLQLQSFRNYDAINLRPGVKANLILGKNAQGKTAILEAIYLLSTSKSHRAAHDEDMVKIGSEVARVSATVERERRPGVRLEVIISRQSKKIVKVNGKRRERVTDMVGQLNAVVFSSLDVEMVKGEPSLRRRFLDMELCQSNAHYLYSFAQYRRILEQRNKTLRDIKESGKGAEILDVLDNQIALYGASMIARRMNFVEELNKEALYVYGSICALAEQLEITYQASVCVSPRSSEEEIRGILANSLRKTRDVDIVRGATSVGPHRDDMVIRIGGLNVREYASQGQQRSAALAIKLAEARVLQSVLGEPPVLLLDDVSAELDYERRAGALRFAADGFQFFVTATREEDIPTSFLSELTVHEVDGGSVMAR